MPSYSRYRTRGQLNIPITQTETWNWTTCSNRTPHSSSFQCGWYQGSKETMWDTVSPDWHRSKGKKFVFNDLFQTKTVIQANGSSSFTLTSVAPTCTSPNFYGTDTSAGSLLPAYVSNANQPQLGPGIAGDRTVAVRDETWTRCLANRGAGQANLLEDLAEMHKTFSMLASPCENIISLVKSFRRNAKRKKGYRRVNADSKALIVFASSEWLRFRYGILPILMSYQAIVKALETGYSKSPRHYTARASARVNDWNSTSYHYSDSAIAFDYIRVTTNEFSVRAFFTDSYTLGALQDLGFNFRNLAGLPWELTRYSFVVDWVVNVGDFFYANIPRPGFVPWGGGVTSESKSRSTWSPSSATTATNPSVRTLSGGVSDSFFIESWRRDRYTPMSNVGSIVIKDDFRLDRFTRAADAVSVAVQWLNSISFDRH